MNSLTLEAGSFRDRNGRILYGDDVVYRALSAQALRNWEILSSKQFFVSSLKHNKIVPTQCVDPSKEHLDHTQLAGWAGLLRHQKIPFISYPYEWTFGMLKDAALLQLELLLGALKEDMILKDSSAYNIQWLGSQPVFIDIPSFEPTEKGEPWVGYRQFCQLFLFPLMLQAYKDVPFHPWLRGNIDGLEVEHFKGMMSGLNLFRPGVFIHGYLQAKAQVKFAKTERDVKKDLRSAGFNKELIKANVLRLQKLLGKLQWKRASSQWSEYANTHSYADRDFSAKMDFVRRVVMSQPWGLVWDLGCNTGTFSRIAAENARYVVAMDADQLALEHFFQSLRQEGNRRILPLLNNLADGSPNLGWRGLERRAITVRGRPDLIFALALIHHVVIGANIPLREFMGWLANIGNHLVIEFVTKDDPMVKTLLKNKEDHYSDYDIYLFEHCLKEYFHVVERMPLLSGTRMLYFASHEQGS